MARTLLRLKGRTKRVALAPGASGPHLPVFSRPPIWSLSGAGGWDDLPRLSLEAAFMAGCDNAGVQLLRTKLLAAPKGGAAVLAIGPLTDAACLLLNHPETAPHIAFVGALISQDSSQPMQLQGAKGAFPVRDFNMVSFT